MAEPNASGRDPANKRRPKATREPKSKDQRPWTPAFAGATNRVRMPCPNWRHGTTTCRQWRSRAGNAFPFCSAERSAWPAGIVASMSEPARASFDATRRARVERGHRRSRRCGRGRFFASFLCRHKKDGRPPGRDPANHRQPKAPKNQTAKIKGPGPRPAPGRRIVSGRSARNEGVGRSVTMQMLALHGAYNCRQWRSRAGATL